MRRVGYGAQPSPVVLHISKELRGSSIDGQSFLPLAKCCYPETLLVEMVQFSACQTVKALNAIHDKSIFIADPTARTNRKIACEGEDFFIQTERGNNVDAATRTSESECYHRDSLLSITLKGGIRFPGPP
jgi:hypothetical protein